MYERKVVEFLTPAEIEALLATPDASTWIGGRDRTLLLVALQTGLRVSELIGLTRDDIVLGPSAQVRCVGKGRKHRCTPLRRDATTALGHESVETTQRYLHADLRLKEQALSRTTPLNVRPPRYRPSDQLLAFLEAL